MNVAAFRIFVTDLVIAEHFYRRSLELHFGGGNVKDGYLVFDLHGLPLVIEEEREMLQRVGQFTGLMLETTDIGEDYILLLNRGVIFDTGPACQSDGGMIAHFRDPSENVLCLFQHP